MSKVEKNVEGNKISCFSINVITLEGRLYESLSA